MIGTFLLTFRDRRLIMNILQDYYSTSVLQDNYKFSTNPLYYSIPADSYAGYKNYVSCLFILNGY